MKQLILALLLLNLTACSSMQTVSIQNLENPDIPSEIQHGDRVEVVTRDSEKVEFSVTDITTEGIGGKFGFIPFENIRRLRVQRPGSSGGNSATWIWGIIGAAALVALIASADSVSVCSGTPCPPE
jgi:hypothetical protein